MTPSSSVLPHLAGAITTHVNRFRQLTTSQVRRLLYTHGSPRGRVVRSSRHLKRLTTLGLLRRVRGVYAGTEEYVYMPPDSKARTANMHTLDISEIYTKLSESMHDSSKSMLFDPEPWCHVQVGHMTLKPDAYVDLGRMRYFLELDRGTEFRSALAQKMRRYYAAYERWEEPTFPLVVWIVHDADRQRFINGIIKSQSEPRLFVCYLFNEAVERLSNG